MEKRTHGYYDKEYVKFVARKLMQAGYTDIRILTDEVNFGADITAVTPKGKNVCVRCLYTDDVIGAGVIQEITGARKYYKSEAALLVTNGVLTRTAEETAMQNRIALKRNYEFSSDTEIGRKIREESEREMKENVIKNARNGCNDDDSSSNASISPINILAGVILVLLGWFLLFGCEFQLQLLPL